MDSQYARLPRLLPSGLQIQRPPLATRRFVRHQRRLQTRPRHPLEQDGSVLDGPRSADCSSIPCRKRQDFSFLAPTGRLVAFLRPALLPRALAFELPPGYESLPLRSSQENIGGSSHTASPGIRSPNPEVRYMPSPAPSEDSVPPYSDISSGPPSDDGYDNFVQPGLENEVYDDAVSFAATANLFYKTAPFTSDPEAYPCWSENCPLNPMPHNLGLYFHYGRRPSEELQGQLHGFGIPSIFEGGNPPEAIWECLVNEYYGNGTNESRSMLLRYRLYHCNATIRSRDVEDVLLARGAEARARRLRRETEESRQEDQQRRRRAPMPVENSENGDTRNETATVVDETARNDGNTIGEDETDTHRTNTSTDGVERGRETYPDMPTSQVTELTYWSVLPDEYTTFLNYGLLPPPQRSAESRSFDGIYLGNQTGTPHEGNIRLPHPYVSPMMMTFMEEIGLAGIWGECLPGLRVLHALIRLVQHASPMEAADIRLVDKFRLENVYGIRPVVARDPESVVGEELWLGLRGKLSKSTTMYI